MADQRRLNHIRGLLDTDVAPLLTNTDAIRFVLAELDECAAALKSVADRWAEEQAEVERLTPIVRAAKVWAKAWDATHGQSFIAGDSTGERLSAARDKAELRLRATLNG